MKLALIGAFVASLTHGMFSQNTQAATTLSSEIDNIKTQYLILQNARSDFQTAQSRGELGATEKSDYLAWIRQLNDQLVRDCQALTKVSSVTLPDDLPCDQLRTTGLTPAAINIDSERTKAEQSNGLIDELNATLGEFDERLLQEQARVKARVPYSDSMGGGSAGDQSGSDDGSGEEQNGDLEADGKQGEQGQTKAGQTQSKGDRQSGSSKTGTPGKTLPGAASDMPEDIPDGSDDDVVARQLREAAEQETDPELKKKLWEEYRRYKAGTG